MAELISASPRRGLPILLFQADELAAQLLALGGPRITSADRRPIFAASMSTPDRPLMAARLLMR